MWGAKTKTVQDPAAKVLRESLRLDDQEGEEHLSPVVLNPGRPAVTETLINRGFQAKVPCKPLIQIRLSQRLSN